MDAENPFEKAQTVDPEVRAYVYSLVTALGGSSSDENGRYHLGDDALACLRDLKRWLKLYDEKTNRLDVARCLAEARLVNGDLLPILASWPEDSTQDRSKARVALACLELLVPITWPLETGGEKTVNHHRHIPYIQQAQVLYKAGVLGYDTCSILRTIVRVGLPSIATSRDERTSRDEGIIKLVLYFLRNITVITPVANLSSQDLDNEVSRSATIEAFRQQDVFALLLTMCSNMGEDFNQQDVIILEILFNLVKGVEVEGLWMTETQRKVHETNELKDVLGKEKGMHRDYAKIAPTRHGRFGTMIWVKREDEKVSSVSGQDNFKDGRNALFNMDKSKKWAKPQQRRKDIDHSIHDFDRSVELTASARQLLRNFVEEFLDSGFNPLYIHLRKAIEREAERLLDVNYRQFFYTVAWLLQAERVRRERLQNEQEKSKLQTDFEVESYALVAGVLNQETFITLNRFMQSSYDNKEWQDLNASMRCFTQILLTVQEMAQSPLEKDQEIADNIQNRIFYEETTHDRIVSILNSYKDQGFGYLDACTELSHVFLRMLERYSKENVDLQIRSRRRTRKRRNEEKKRSKENGEEESLDEQSENEDIADIAKVSRDRRFDFTRFAARFTSQRSVNTFIAFTAFYRDLSVGQLKRAHRFFYRVAFKQELAVLLYRVDITALFYKMIKGPEGLDVSHALYREWNELVKQVLKRLFKKLDQRPELVVEMLFSKINATLYYLEYGREKQTMTTWRAPPELEVNEAVGRGIRDKIGIVMAALDNDDKGHLAGWVKAVLVHAVEERQSWENKAAARLAEEEGDRAEAGASENAEQSKTPYIVVHPANDDVRTAIFRNAKLKLLMTLVGLERLGIEDVPDATWIVPSTLTSQGLGEARSTMEQFDLSPWVDEDGNQEPENLLRRAPKVRMDEHGNARRDAFITDDSEVSVDNEDFPFPNNVRSKSTALNALDKNKKKRRRRREKDITLKTSDDEAVDMRRKGREAAGLEKRRKIKSELYIRDSEEEMEAEETNAFFTREEATRKRQAERVKEAMRVGVSEGLGVGKKRKSQGRDETAGKRRQIVVAGLDFDGDENIDMLDQQTSSSQPHDASDDGVGEEETPLSSQDQGSDSGLSSAKALKELRQPRAQEPQFLDKVGGVVEDEDVERAATSAPRRRVRAGFIIDSDDDD